MTTLSGLERRAQMYSALGEPRRLAIVDRLALADAAPGELARDLGIATNLLAHHLRVLEEAAVIRRARSEGDRRRSYIRLRLDDPIVGALGYGNDDSATWLAHTTSEEGKLGGAERVVFVCTHNSARSQLAAAMWTGISTTPATSAGTHPARRVHPRAVAVGRRHGLRLAAAIPAHTDDVLRGTDLVVAVCDNAHEELGQPGSAGPRGRMHWSVPDPVRMDTDEAFEAAYQDIVVRVNRLAHAVTRNSSLPRRSPGVRSSRPRTQVEQHD